MVIQTPPDHSESPGAKAAGPAHRPGPKGVNLGRVTKPVAEPEPELEIDATLDDELDEADEALEEAEAGDDEPVLTKRALFTRVKARAEGVRGRELRVAIEALLEELGAALVAGETLKLPPFGTMKVQRHKQAGGADVVVCKLRRKKPGPHGKDPLADAAE